MLSKKRFALSMVVAVTSMAMLLAACGSSTASNNSGTSVNYSGTITIWDDWTGAYLSAKQQIVNNFMQQYPNVKINLVTVSLDDNKLITTEKSGVNAPDIVAFPVDHIGTLATAGVIQPIDSYESAAQLAQTYSAPAAAGVQFNNHVYGIPEVTEIVTLFYNKSMVSASQLPTTTSQMLTFEQTYAQQHPGDYGIVWPPNDAYYNAGFFYAYGASYIDAQGNTQIGSAASVQAATFLQSFNQYLPKSLNNQTASALFSEGKAAATIDGPWAYDTYAKAIGANNVGFAVLPTVDSTNKPISPFVGGKTFMVTKTATNVPLDVAFMKYFTNESNQVTMCVATGEIPANLAAGNNPQITGNAVISAFFAQAKNGVPFPNTPYMSAVWTPMANALVADFQGNTTPAAAMSQAQSLIQKGVQNISGN